MEDFQIRYAKLNDVPDIMNIIDVAVKNLPKKSLFFVDTKDFIEDHIENKGFTLVATKKEKIAGYLVVRFPGRAEDNLGQHIKKDIDLDRVAHMESCAILPEFRHKGLQTNLVATAEEKLKKTKYCYYMGTVDPENEFSKRAMMRNNYQIIDTVKKYGGLTRHIIYKKIEY